MTEKQIQRHYEMLCKRLAARQGVLSRARGRRRDKGGRIQSTAETRATARLNETSRELHKFCGDYGLKYPY